MHWEVILRCRRKILFNGEERKFYSSLEENPAVSPFHVALSHGTDARTPKKGRSHPFCSEASVSVESTGNSGWTDNIVEAIKWSDIIRHLSFKSKTWTRNLSPNFDQHQGAGFSQLNCMAAFFKFRVAASLPMQWKQNWTEPNWHATFQQEESDLEDALQSRVEGWALV